MITSLVKSGTFSFCNTSLGTFNVPSIQYVSVFHTTCYFCNNMMSKV